MPPRPEPPKVTVTAAQAEALSGQVGASARAYAGYLGRDSRAYRVEPVATPDELGRVFPHSMERERRILEPGGEEEVLGLRLGLRAESVAGSKKPHLVLRVENTRDSHLAYRIETRPSGRTRDCREKRDLPHNAVAIAPGAVEERTECLYRKGATLAIEQVEIVEIPALGYHYASALPPSRIGLDPRTSRGHRPTGEGTVCPLRLAADLERALDAGEMTWRDLIDFYGRHRCQTYVIPYGYKAFREDRERALPVGAEAQ